nr:MULTISPECIES: DNA polymerase sliding clamp [Halococcus]
MPTAPAETDETAATVEDDTAIEQNEETEEEAEREEEESLPTGNVGRFEAAIEVGHLQEVIDAAHAIVDECRIHLDTDELVIRAVDPANVAMIDENVSADAFEAYDTDCGEIGINLERLDEVVGIADNNDDLVQFDLDPKTRKLDVQVNAVEYTLALIDPESIRAEPDIPDLDLPATVSMDEAEFKRAIRAADMVSDHITLQVDEREECFIANAEGDTDDVDLELSGDDLEDADWGSAYSLFSLEYLKDLRKPIPSDTVVRMQLGEEFPIKLTFELADGAVDVEFMVAPRIQSD